MLKTFFFAAVFALAAAPSIAEPLRHGLAAAPAPVTQAPAAKDKTAQAKPSVTGIASREALDISCSVRWKRAYDGYGAYTGEAKVKMCD